VGFSDASYFANVFKKVTGMYPSKYRELFQNPAPDPYPENQGG